MKSSTVNVGETNSHMLHAFFADGVVALSLAAAPSAPTSLDVAHKGSRADCSPQVAHTLFLGRTAECVSSTRVQVARELKIAVLPHSHGEGPQVSRSTGTRLNSMALAVLPLFTNAKFRVCAVLPRVPRFITVLPLPSSLDHKSSALPGPGLKSRYCQT